MTRFELSRLIAERDQAIDNYDACLDNTERALEENEKLKSSLRQLVLSSRMILSVIDSHNLLTNDSDKRREDIQGDTIQVFSQTVFKSSELLRSIGVEVVDGS